MVIEVPENVRTDSEGYTFLIDFYHQTKATFLDEVILDFGATTWFEANLLAVLGALLSRLESELNSVRLSNLNQKIRILFQRNQFLSHFGGLNLPDFYGTTIKYTRFKTSEEKLFKYYLDNELLTNKVMPNMSAELRKKINESIFEIFNNAVIHGQCKSIFTCGQYFPANAKLDFTIVDLGVTIRNNVVHFLGKDCSGEEAIQWAVTENHTTRTGSIPGGLGLKLIREFVELNRGKIQIVTSDGYWEQKQRRVKSDSFEQEFPGTIVNLEFNIEDKSYYKLSSEIAPEDIF